VHGSGLQGRPSCPPSRLDRFLVKNGLASNGVEENIPANNPSLEDALPRQASRSAAGAACSQGLPGTNLGHGPDGPTFKLKSACMASARNVPGPGLNRLTVGRARPHPAGILKPGATSPRALPVGMFGVLPQSPDPERSRG